MIALCCGDKACPDCGHAFDRPCRLKQELIDEFNALGIPDMEPLTTLNALWGDYINLTFTLPGGQCVKFWDDGRVYLGNRMRKRGTDRYYGLTADERYLLVCEYGEKGVEPEIVVYQRRK